MHLKNYSLIRNALDEIALSPAYNLLATKLLLPEDKEQMALTINGKKTKLKRSDFEALAEKLEIPNKAVLNSLIKIEKAFPDMQILINESFLPQALKKDYSELVIERLKILMR